MAQIRVRQVRSAIGIKPKHRGTLRALGLGRIGKTRDLPDSPDIQGMVRAVQHLVTVEEVATKKPTKTEKKPAEQSSTKQSKANPAKKVTKTEK